jgi:Flp pilus assembly secretin CpaC
MGRMIPVNALRIAALAALSLLSAATAHAASRINVGLSQGARMMVGGSAANVVVANPAIADVTVVDAHSIVVLGKSYGSTQIMVMDSSGRLLLDSIVTVTAPQEGHMTYYRGPTSPSEFDCSPRCEATSDKTQGAAAPAPSGAPG